MTRYLFSKGRSPIDVTLTRGVQLVSLLTIANACTTKNYYEQHYEIVDSDAGDDAEPEPDPGPAEGDAGVSKPGSDAGPVPLEEGAPIANVPKEEIELDVFDTVGNRYWFVVSDEQVSQMNARYGGGGPIFFFNQFGDIYTPGGEGDVTFADHLLVTTAGEDPKTADFGKIQVRLIGESTGRPWALDSLPNLKLDSDEFVEGNRIGGVKHMRFNNAVVGNIFREKLTLDLYRRLGYSAPRATYAWVSSSVWGPDVAVPYVLVESYKPQFCKQREEEMGGGCVNMWEFPGDFGYGSFEQEQNCQFHECDNERVLLLEQVVMTTPEGDGFKAALSDWLEWDTFHQFQCLSWILETGDDYLHNTNNLVLAEREDGKFQLLPYSVDISLGQDWYQDVTLAGGSSLARGCQSDPECWADTISTCETLIDDFAAADPIGMLDDLYATLEAEGMLRSGDESRYQSLSAYLERRLTELPEELEANREGPNYDNCEYPFILCGDYCALPEECYLCDPGGFPEPLPEPLPEPAPDPRPIPIIELALSSGFDAGVAAEDAGVTNGDADIVLGPGDPVPGEPIPEPVPEPVPEPIPDGGVVEPPVDPCLPYIELYGAVPLR